MAEVGQDSVLSPDAVRRLGRFARSRRFQLGRPRDFALAPGRLLFLRSLAADDPVTGLWSRSLVTGEERLLADPRELQAGRPEEVPAAELRRRERMRESARGIVAYSTSADGRLAAFALSGRLLVCDAAAGATREIPVTGSASIPSSARTALRSPTWPTARSG
jgi:dipeptidyl-peptidase-4